MKPCLLRVAEPEVELEESESVEEGDWEEITQHRQESSSRRLLRRSGAREARSWPNLIFCTQIRHYYVKQNLYES